MVVDLDKQHSLCMIHSRWHMGRTSTYTHRLLRTLQQGNTTGKTDPFCLQHVLLTFSMDSGLWGLVALLPEGRLGARCPKHPTCHPYRPGRWQCVTTVPSLQQVPPQGKPPRVVPWTWPGGADRRRLIRGHTIRALQYALRCRCDVPLPVQREHASGPAGSPPPPPRPFPPQHARLPRYMGFATNCALCEDRRDKPDLQPTWAGHRVRGC